MPFQLEVGRLVIWAPRNMRAPRHRRGTIETLPPRPTPAPYYGVRWDDGGKTWEPEQNLLPVHNDPQNDLPEDTPQALKRAPASPHAVPIGA
jgi:hypothetical protein